MVSGNLRARATGTITRPTDPDAGAVNERFGGSGKRCAVFGIGIEMVGDLGFNQGFLLGQFNKVWGSDSACGVKQCSGRFRPSPKCLSSHTWINVKSMVDFLQGKRIIPFPELCEWAPLCVLRKLRLATTLYSIHLSSHCDVCPCSTPNSTPQAPNPKPDALMPKS